MIQRNRHPRDREGYSSALFHELGGLADLAVLAALADLAVGCPGASWTELDARDTRLVGPCDQFVRQASMNFRQSELQ